MGKPKHFKYHYTVRHIWMQKEKKPEEQQKYLVSFFLLDYIVSPSVPELKIQLLTIVFTMGPVRQK